MTAQQLQSSISDLPSNRWHWPTWWDIGQCLKTGVGAMVATATGLLPLGTPFMLVIKAASVAAGSAFIGNLFNRISKDQVREAVAVVVRAEEKAEAKQVASELDLQK